MFGSGIRMEKALASLNGPVSLSLEDFLAPPRLTPLQRLPSLEDCEKKLALDLNRRGSHQSIEGYAPVITFGAAGQDAEMVHIQDLSGLSVQERENFSNGRVSPISHDLVGKARALCGNNEAQLRQVVQGMGQAATIIMRVTSAATGAVQDEHSPIDVDVRRQTNGDVTLRFHTPPSSRLDADYTFTITPDGKGTLTDFRMQARPAGR